MRWHHAMLTVCTTYVVALAYGKWIMVHAVVLPIW
jgi:hypothetical protein